MLIIDRRQEDLRSIGYYTLETLDSRYYVASFNAFATLS